MKKQYITLTEDEYLLLMEPHKPDYKSKNHTLLSGIQKLYGFIPYDLIWYIETFQKFVQDNPNSISFVSGKILKNKKKYMIVAADFENYKQQQFGN